MYTHNQVIGLLTRAAQAHKGLKSFGFGELFDMSHSPLLYNADANLDQAPTYPLMWGVLRSSQLINNPTAASELQTVYSIIVCDKVNNDQSNQDEIFSDTQQTCLDIIAMLQDDSFYPYFFVNKQANLQPFSGLQENDDSAIGWTFDLTFRQTYTSDFCAIPATIPTPLPQS